MLAGNTNYETGTQVRLANITDPNDLDLNGRAGVLCHPFRKFPIRDVGVRLNAVECTPQRCFDQFGDGHIKHTCHEQSVTVYRDEIEVIGERR